MGLGKAGPRMDGNSQHDVLVQWTKANCIKGG
jgi:hypothetical protein